MKFMEKVMSVKAKVQKHASKIYAGATTAIATMLMSTNAFAAGDSSLDVSNATNTIVDMINSLLSPILAIVGAVGTLYCVVLGVKFAKAEEPQDRMKTKSHLKNAIIGFVLIFVLIVALKLMMPQFEAWVNSNASTNIN